MLTLTRLTYFVQFRRVLRMLLHPHQILYVEEALLLKYIDNRGDVLLISPYKHKAGRDQSAREGQSLEVGAVVVERGVDVHHIELLTEGGEIIGNRVLCVHTGIRDGRLIRSDCVSPCQRDLSNEREIMNNTRGF